MGTFAAVLRRWGRPAALHDGEMVQIGPAMVQPLLEKNEQWTPTPLGRKREDRFLFFGAPELEVERLGEDGYIEWDGAQYEVVTAQTVCLGGRAVYRWAVLRLREEMDSAEQGGDLQNC